MIGLRMIAALALAAAGLPGTLHAQAADPAHYAESVDRLDGRLAALSANGAAPILKGDDAALFDAVVDSDIFTAVPVDLTLLRPLCRKVHGIFQRFLDYSGNDPATRLTRWGVVERQGVRAMIADNRCARRAIHALIPYVAGVMDSPRIGELRPVANRTVAGLRLQLIGELMMLGEATTSPASRDLVVADMFDDIALAVDTTPPAERIAYRAELRRFAAAPSPVVRTAAEKVIAAFSRTDCDAFCTFLAGP